MAAGLADTCEVHWPKPSESPTGLDQRQLFGTGKLSEEKLVELIRKVFPTKTADILRVLQLKRPIYQKTAATVIFGRDSFPWEQTDKWKSLSG